MHNDRTTLEMETIVQNHVNALMEHFECVQILTSLTSQNGTEFVMLGGGNWFARQGMAHEFIGRDQAHTSAHEIAKVIPNTPPEEGEDWKKA